MLLLLGCVACVPPDRGPCSTAQTLEYDPTLPVESLALLAGMGDAIEDSPPRDAPPSPRFGTAERDLKVEFWMDAAKGLLAVASGETGDSRAVRQVAHFQLGVALYRLKYFTEAHTVFRSIAKTSGHPRRDSAQRWLRSKYCEEDAK